MLVTILGNGVVIISIAHIKQLHTPTNTLIMSLAVADLLLGVTVMPFSTMRAVEGCWYFGDAFCLLHSSFDMFLTSVSIFHLVFIAIDRYEAVCSPLRYSTKITIPIAWLMVFASWAVAALYSYCLLYSKANVRGLDEFIASIYCLGSCNLFLNALWVLSTVSSVISFYIPGVGMISIYLKIFLIAQRKAHSIHGTTNQNSVGKSQRKATKTLGIIMRVFLSFWTAFYLQQSIDPFIQYSIPPLLGDTLVWFGYLNSAFNPIVYAFFYTWFRRALRINISDHIFHRGSCRFRLYSE
ncbi:trace amine-associated receptor 13c-like [Oncorhynchus nerka]|uniref:trace amine-associated receptor 13c-like n=1 Tax=Oncorhynchus nerka TaxID=8023 RepID=UPI0031B88950